MNNQKILKYTLFFLFLIPCRILYPQIFTKEVRFDHLSVDEGLSHSTVFSVLQDYRGFMWFGTLDGLNKYDGYSFKLYKSDPYDRRTLSNNIVFKIFEDRDKNLWIGTLGGGLNKYDRLKEEFIQYRYSVSDSNSLSNDNVRSIYQDSKGRIWVGTDNGLNLFDPESGLFKRFYYNRNSQNSLSNNYIWSVYESGSHPGILWLGTYNGLNRFDVEKNKFKHFVNIPGNRSTISNNYVWSITGSGEYLFIGTNRGLNKFNIRTESFERNFYSSEVSHSLQNDRVWTLNITSNGNLMVGTLGDGALISENLVDSGSPMTFKRYQKNISLQSSLSHNDVWSIYEDRTGILWIATELGINKYDPSKEKFYLIKNDPFNKNSLSYNEVTSIFKEKGGNLWIGTRKGLNRLNPFNGNIVRFDSVGKSGLSNNYIRAINRISSGELLIGTNGGGLLVYNHLKNSFRQFSRIRRNASLSSENVTSILEDSEGKLWIGTLGGINLYDPVLAKMRVFSKKPDQLKSLSHDYVYTIYQTRDKKIWIGTLGGGLNLFDPEDQEFISYVENPDDSSSIRNNTIWAIYEDRSRNLWIGTNNGLNRFDRVNSRFEYLSNVETLKNSAVYGILEDDSGDLWLSTNNGIIKYNHEKKYFKNYSKDHGAQSKQFTGNAYFKDENGIIYFGGINGLNYFNPGSIIDNKHIPAIVLTDFQVFNRSLQIGENNQLKKSITETEEIELNFNQNVFSFEYAALHYSSPQLNQYAYKMEGFDKDWIQAGTRRFATYTNLDPGRYTFKVIGSNNDGIWNTEGTMINLIILPPFWKTWWFISASALFLVLVISTIIYLRLKPLLEIERLRVKISADLHDDIGTRLTEISLLTDIIYHSDNYNDPVSDKETVKKIGSIARSLIENMSDIVWLINPKRDSLYELFLKLKDRYEEILSHFHINLHINNLEFIEKIRLPMDYRKNVYLIFKEAINNAIKYSECSEISLNADVTGNKLTITMYDNGKGFDASQAAGGNGLENMKKRAEATGGKLRIQSKPGEGTMINFRGRLNKSW